MKAVEKRTLKKQEKGENSWSKERGHEVEKEAEKGQVKGFDNDVGGLIKRRSGIFSRPNQRNFMIFLLLSNLAQEQRGWEFAWRD